MTLKSTVSGRYSSYPSAYRNTARGEVIRKPVDYDDPLSVIGAILEEIDCKNHFTRSNDPVVFTDEASAPSSRRFPKT